MKKIVACLLSGVLMFSSAFTANTVFAEEPDADETDPVISEVAEEEEQDESVPAEEIRDPEDSEEQTEITDVIEEKKRC